MRIIWPATRVFSCLFLLTFVLIVANATLIAQAGFTVSAIPASLSIPQNGQGVSIITTTISGGFNSAIALSASGVPVGTSVSFNPTTIGAPGTGSSTLTLTVLHIGRTGTFPITVTANGGGIKQTATMTLTITAQGQANFTVAAIPASLTVGQGNQGTSGIYTVVSGGFRSAISLSASGMPTGTTVSFNPQTIPAPGVGTSTMTITVGSNTPQGTYPITVTGNGGGIQQTATLSLTVASWGQGFDFRNTALFVPDPANYTYVLPGTIYPTTVNGVTFGWTTAGSVQGDDRSTLVDPRLAGINSAQNGTPATFYVNLPSSGTYNVALAMGDDGAAECSTQCQIQFLDGSTVVATVSGGPTNQGYFYDAAGNNWSAVAWPASNVSQQVTLTGSLLAVVVGTNNATGDLTPIASLAVTQTPITITASPAALSIAQGNQGTSTITTTIGGGFNSAISLSASGAPSGTTVSFNPQTIPAPGAGSSTMIITVGSGTPTGTYPITVTGNGGGIQQSIILTLTVTTAPSFTISASPASLSIQQGNQGTSTITTAVSGGFNSDISLSASGMPSGTTVSFNPQDIPPPGAGSSAMTITVGSGTPTGTYPITVTGNGGGIQQNTTVTLTVTVAPSFTISASPASLSIQQGNQGASTITTTISGGFNSDISLSASGMPSGTTVSFNPQDIPPPGAGSSAMTITVGSGTPTGTYPITVTGNGGGVQQNTTVMLTVTAAPSFAMSASPASLSIQQGNQGASTITTTISGGFNSDISLSASGMPSGTTVSFNPQDIPPPGAGNSAMTITVDVSTPTGTYPITVTGNGGGIQQNTTVTLTVTAAPPDFTIALSPSSVSVQQGFAGSSTVTTAIIGSFNSSIDLSASGTPTGASVSFNPQTIAAPGAGTSAMTITVGSNTPLGTYPITVTGNGGGDQHSATLNLTVVSWGQGFDFRNTGGFVTDPANYNYVLPGTTYPTTVNGVTFGWTTPDLVQGADRSTLVDPRLAGINSAENGSPATFYVDLPSSGTYNVSLAMGDDGSAQCSTQCEVQFFDGSTAVATVTGGPTDLGYFYDAAGNNWSAATWPTSNVTQQVTLAGSRLTVVVGTNNATGDVTPVASVGVVQTPSFTITASPASLSIAQGNQGGSVITTSISGGFSSDVTLSASGVPSGTTVSFTPQTIPAPGAGSSSMTITVGSNTPTGTYPITVTGSGGGIQQSVVVTLIVVAPPNFTISASPSSLSIAQGNQGTSTITTSIGGGFNSDISLSASGMPSGTTVSFNPQDIPAPGAGSSSMTITVGSNTPTGTYPITVTGNGGGIQQTVIVTLTVVAPPNFTISASPSSLSIAQGNQGTSTIITTITGGFNSSINLSASGMPAGATVSFNPPAIPAPGSGSSTMVITVGNSTPTGTYPITVTGNGGGIQQNATVTLTVTASGPTFTITAAPAALSVVQGSQNSGTVVTAISGGFNGTVNLSASGVPLGVSVSFNPSTIPAPGAGVATMTVTALRLAPLGSFPITINASGGGIKQSASVTLTVTAPGLPNFTLSATPTLLSIVQGTPGVSTITTVATNGFNGGISLSASGMPAGISVSFSPQTIPAPGSGSSTMTINVANGAPLGTYPITVTASSGAVWQTTAVTVMIASFAPSASPASLTIAPGNQGTSQITTTISGGFNFPVVLSTSGMPAGASASFNPPTISAPGAGTSIMTITVGSNTPVGTYPITMTGSGGGLQQSITVTLTVPAAGFTLGVSPASVTVPQNTLQYLVAITRINGFNSSISLSASGAPLGLTVGISPNVIPAPGVGNSAITVGAFRAAAPGTYPITITATGGGLKQAVTFPVTVTASGQPNFTLAAGPASPSVVQGLQTACSITGLTSGTFNNAITLSASGLPNGITASFAPATLAAPGSGDSVLTFTANNNVPAGSYPVTVTGNGGGIQQTTTVNLTVTPAGAESLPVASFTQPYADSLQASFGTPPYSYQLVTGVLPAGLTMDTYGNITGATTTAGQFAFSVQVTDSSQPPQQQIFNYTLSSVIQLDSYSGVTAAPVPGCVSTGYFQVMKVNGRWVFADPNCYAFFQRSLYDSDRLFILQGIMQSRYGNSTAAWANHSLQRVTGWGFNAIDVYSSYYMLPVGTYNNPGASIKVPFVLFFPTLQQILTSPQNVGLPEPIKDICRGFDGNGYYFYCSNLADIFDPKWQLANTNELAVQQSVYTGGFNTDPWVTAVSLGDTDYVFALKGNGLGPYGIPTYPHPGMLVATVNFQYSGYLDNTLYSKYAWINYLQNEYGTIDALNAAWNTSGFYTAFGDAGGFGAGTGVLDEDGRHTAWFGSDFHDRYFTLVGVNPNLAADMDAFLYQFTYQVYSVQATTIKSYDQNHLLACGNFGGIGEGGTRLPVLQALKDAGCNILVGSWDSYYPSVALAGNQAQYDATGLPEYLWYGVGSQADSDVSGYSYPAYGVGYADYPNQLTRAQQYAYDQQNMYGAQGTNGDYYVIGTGFWSLTDNNSEKANFGLITFMDNAYDGQCAVIAAGNDQYGFPCGGEVANYGDFLDGVTQTNSIILQQLIQQLLQVP